MQVSENVSREKLRLGHAQIPLTLTPAPGKRPVRREMVSLGFGMLLGRKFVSTECSADEGDEENSFHFRFLIQCSAEDGKCEEQQKSGELRGVSLVE